MKYLTEEESLREAELNWCRAIEQNDVQLMAGFMADECVIVGADGIGSKEAFLGFVSNGDLVHTTMDFEILDTRIYGQTGVIISKGISAGYYKGKPFSFYEWSTSIFVKRDDRWKAVLTMLAPAKS